MQNLNSRISAKTKILAVIGDPIEHSMSPTMHNAAIQELGLDYVYIAFHVKTQNLKQACDGFRALNITGINVTIPHKIDIMKYLDEIDPLARGIGAINTIKNKNGKLLGRNTDGEGAILSLKNAGFDISNKKCLILGAGGASRAVSFALSTQAGEVIITDIVEEKSKALVSNLNIFIQSKDAESIFKDRDIPKVKAISFNEDSIKKELEDVDLLVNATPMGMAPKFLDKSPLDGFNIVLKPQIFVFDCVYNPLQTKLLKTAKENGCKTLEGINMLVNQGAAAFEWWTGVTPNWNTMKKAAMEKLNIS